MRAKLLHIIRIWPLFLLLLPVFYMLHGLSENFSPGLSKTALLQAVLYTMIGVSLSMLFFPLLKNFRKAALVSLYLLSFNFFFGNLHDIAKNLLGRNIFLVKYMFIIAFILTLLICIIIELRKTKRKFYRSYQFLNTLLIILIFVELPGLLPKVFNKYKTVPANLTSQFIPCDTCATPDVFVIIADGYAGREELKEIFAFDNTDFERELLNRDFHIVNNSRSNYNATVYSMASLFSMGYIDLSGKNLVTQRDMLLCRSIINHNNTGAFFSQRGYTFHNFSFFDLQGLKKAVTNYYFHTPGRILTFGTFINRFQKDAGFNFLSKKQILRIERNDFFNDEILDSLVKALATKRPVKPKFIYTHFTRPHHPHFVDRNGDPFALSDSLKGFDRIKKEYIEYLLYTNKRLLQLIDHIRKNAATPPVILLASDHGFRLFIDEPDKKYYFMNLSAIYLPNRQYEGFYNGMSAVNTFRAILNAQFGQRLPILKDSTSFILELEDK